MEGARVIYLGLGSNLGDRIGHLSRALHLMMEQKLIQSPIRISSVYTSKALLPEAAPAAWNLDYLNLVVEAETDYSPIDLLKACKKIEKELGRQARPAWAPREIDIDLLYDRRGDFKSEELKLPHPAIRERDFVYLPLRELGLELDPKLQPKTARPISTQVLPTELLGILNLTPDSFSDGNKRYESPELALQRFSDLMQSGVSLIDIGAESTRPGAEILSADEEWARLENLLPRFCEMRSREMPWLKLSLDSRHPANMFRAYEMGVDWINDVSASIGHNVLDFYSKSRCSFIWMHHLSIPADRNIVLPEAENPIDSVLDWFETRLRTLEAAGVDKSRCILDPGIGFGKTPRQSLAIIQDWKLLKKLGLRILIGHSRKSFLSLITKEAPAHRDPATAYLSAYLMKAGVDYLRVHEPDSSIQAMKSALLVKH